MSHFVEDPAQTVLQGFYTLGERTVNHSARLRGALRSAIRGSLAPS
jgi:hypothetical protein